MAVVTLTVAIRDMARADIGAVAGLEQAIYAQPWSDALFLEELAQPNRAYVVAEADGEIVGYAGILVVEGDAHVTTIAVAPQGRRRRLGSRLMLALVDRALARGARHMTLEVRVSNVDAQRLYERFGFIVVGKRKNYYKDEDALVMWATGIDSPEYADRIAGIRESVGQSHE